MPGQRFSLLTASAAALLVTLLVTLLSGATARADQTVPCNISLERLKFSQPLNRVAQRVASGEPIKIVAIGSSSTAGAGASSPANNYPNRLQAELTQIFPRQQITVVNRGVNGEEVVDMLRRFDSAVIEQKPDLVIWQLGTNSVIRDHVMVDHAAGIRSGINRIKSVGSDVVLLDPQYAPKVIAKPEAEAMVNLIALTAKQENVGLFKRFDFMRRWQTVERLPFETFINPDGLHLNDWSYGCLAKGIAAAVAEASTRPVASAAAVTSTRPTR